MANSRTPAPAAGTGAGRRSRAAELGFSALDRAGLILPWAAGVHLPTLRESGTDRPFYSALGACALVFSLLSGLLFMLAAAFVTRQRDPWALWWVAIVWAAVMLSVERLILQISSGRLWALAIASAPRLALSVLIALSVANVAALAFFKPEIDSFLSARRAQALARVAPQVDRIYGPKIALAKRDVARLRGHERKVERRIAREDLLASQSAGASGMCTPRCRYYEQLAAGDRAQLATMQARNRGRFAQDNADLRLLQRESRATSQERRRSIQQQDGLLARDDALSQIQRLHPELKSRVRIVTLLLIALDLTAFVTKVVRNLTVKDAAYDKNLEGRRAEESLRGEERLERSRTEAARLRDEGRAARRRNRWRADAPDFERYATGGWEADEPSDDGAAIDGHSLAEFTADMQDWESRPIRVPATLRRGAFVGLGLLGATLAGAVALGARGLPLVAAACLAAAALLLRTRGFREAPGWGLRAMFATLVTGIAAPLVLVLLNV